jgi:hypothetical protein
MANVSPDLLAKASGTSVKATPVSEQRYTFELPRDARPEPFVAELANAGAVLVSVNPLHTTLEEIFVRQVALTSSAREGVL